MANYVIYAISYLMIHRNGSTIVLYYLDIKDTDAAISVNDVLKQVELIVNNGSLGNFSVDTSYTICQRDKVTGDCIVSTASSATPFPTSTSSMIDESIFSSEFVTSVISSVSESSIAPSVTETEILSSSITPEVSTVKVVSSLKLDETFSEDLNDNTSTKFKQLEKEFCEEVIVVFNF